MPTRVDIPICSVNTTKIRHLSTSVENLHGMWSGENFTLPHTNRMTLKPVSVLKMRRVFGRRKATGES